MSDETPTPQLAADLATLAAAMTLPPPPSSGGGKKATGMPPGNPNNVSATEREDRRRDIETYGAAEAATRAWARAGKTRAKAKPKVGGGSSKTSAPTDATDFAASPIPLAKVTAKGKDKKDIEKWSRSVMFAHAMLAMKLGRAEFQIDEEEAKLLTEAVIDLSEYYNIKLKGQAGAWAGLIYAVGMVYGPRVGAMIVQNINRRKVGG